MTRPGSHGRADLDEQVERTLALARTAREPKLADKQRILEAVAPHLGPAAPSPLDDAAAPSPLDDAAVSGVREVAVKAGGSYGSALTRLVQPLLSAPATLQHLVWVGAVTGGLGLWLGTRQEPPAHEPASSAQHAMRRVRESAAPAAQSLAPQSLEPSASASRSSESPAVESPAAPSSSSSEPHAGEAPRAEPAEPRTPAAAALAVPQKPAPQKPVPEEPTPETPAPEEPMPEPVRVGAPPPPERLRVAAVPSPPQDARPEVAPLGAAAAGGAGASSAGDAHFLEAVRLLQSAQRSIESHAPSVALGLLAELDARFPESLLNEERLATRVLALCESGDLPRARQAAAELTARNSSSIYAARIAQSCAGRATLPPLPR